VTEVLASQNEKTFVGLSFDPRHRAAGSLSNASFVVIQFFWPGIVLTYYHHSFRLPAIAESE